MTCSNYTYNTINTTGQKSMWKLCCTKVLEVSNTPQRKRVVSKIVELVPNLRKLMLGKHIITKIEKLTGEHLALADDNVGAGQIGGSLSGGALNDVTPGLIKLLVMLYINLHHGQLVLNKEAIKWI